MAFTPKKALQENTTEIFLVSDLFSFWFIFPHQCFTVTLIAFFPPRNSMSIQPTVDPSIDSKHKTIFSL